VNLDSPVYKPQQLTLSLGSPHIEEVVLDLKFHLVPSMHFWNNIHAAKMVCRGIAELLAPTKKISVLEVGCGFGLIGLYLSKVRMGCELGPVNPLAY
jgi:tRNA/tmRNA/rRNA uracil-C5-methylase (TrmA/RlmC/RlmD family)